ncbi:hypothetical protein CK203_082635 [Vitis vinifera]|uniref:Retrotransposon Copia-like N-terminal domain-containing protein n=1 Tax=Vitis vinifera TaxID=29760 RepID=A0A438BWJ3_VITVI|nr:hypothetical protein CK203_082635 [Vitis vinifera]
MATKNPIFTSVISGSPNITLEKLIGSENYLSWSASVELWFMGQGYEDHLVTPKDAILMLTKCNGRKSMHNYATYYGNLLIPKFYIIFIDKFFMVLTLIGLRPNLESVQDQILASPSVPSLDDVFARLLRLSSTQTLSTDGPSDSSLHGWPPRTAHIAQSTDPLLSRPDSAASSTSQIITLTGSDYDAYLRYLAATSASVARTGNVSVCFTQSPFLGPWILDSGASDHISGIVWLILSLPYLSILSFMPLSDHSTRKTIGIGREFQGLYHLTSPSSPAACISLSLFQQRSWIFQKQHGQARRRF